MQETQETGVWFLDWKDPLEEENGNTLQYSFLNNPMYRGAWWATVHGSLRVRHDWATKHAIMQRTLMKKCQFERLDYDVTNFLKPFSKNICIWDVICWFQRTFYKTWTILGKSKLAFSFLLCSFKEHILPTYLLSRFFSIMKNRPAVEKRSPSVIGYWE